jgi:hypothetical protein
MQTKPMETTSTCPDLVQLMLKLTFITELTKQYIDYPSTRMSRAKQLICSIHEL